MTDRGTFRMLLSSMTNQYHDRDPLVYHYDIGKRTWINSCAQLVKAKFRPKYKRSAGVCTTDCHGPENTDEVINDSPALCPFVWRQRSLVFCELQQVFALERALSDIIINGTDDCLTAQMIAFEVANLGYFSGIAWR